MAQDNPSQHSQQSHNVHPAHNNHSNEHSVIETVKHGLEVLHAGNDAYNILKHIAKGVTVAEGAGAVASSVIGMAAVAVAFTCIPDGSYDASADRPHRGHNLDGGINMGTTADASGQGVSGKEPSGGSSLDTPGGYSLDPSIGGKSEVQKDTSPLDGGVNVGTTADATGYGTNGSGGSSLDTPGGYSGYNLDPGQCNTSDPTPHHNHPNHTKHDSHQGKHHDDKHHDKHHITNDQFNQNPITVDPSINNQPIETHHHHSHPSHHTHHETHHAHHETHHHTHHSDPMPPHHYNPPY